MAAAAAAVDSTAINDMHFTIIFTLSSRNVTKAKLPSQETMIHVFMVFAHVIYQHKKEATGPKSNTKQQVERKYKMSFIDKVILVTISKP